MSEYFENPEPRLRFVDEAQPDCEIWDEQPEAESIYDSCKENVMPTTTTPWLGKSGDGWVGLDDDEWVATIEA